MWLDPRGEKWLCVGGDDATYLEGSCGVPPPEDAIFGLNGISQVLSSFQLFLGNVVDGEISP